jgi:hypothetical protein
MAECLPTRALKASSRPTVVAAVPGFVFSYGADMVAEEEASKMERRALIPFAWAVAASAMLLTGQAHADTVGQNYGGFAGVRKGVAEVGLDNLFLLRYNSVPSVDRGAGHNGYGDEYCVRGRLDAALLRSRQPVIVVEPGLFLSEGLD